jgi:hypothetical protein
VELAEDRTYLEATDSVARWLGVSTDVVRDRSRLETYMLDLLGYGMSRREMLFRLDRRAPIKLKQQSLSVHDDS